MNNYIREMLKSGMTARQIVDAVKAEEEALEKERKADIAFNKTRDKLVDAIIEYVEVMTGEPADKDLRKDLTRLLSKDNISITTREKKKRAAASDDDIIKLFLKTII